MTRFKWICTFLLICSYLLCLGDATATQAQENNGDTPLMLAAYDGNIQLMQRLVAQGSQVDQKNKYGLTALFFAAGATRTQATPKGSTESVRFLLEHGATFNIKSSRNGFNALMAAADNQNAGSVLLLLQHGADINSLTTDGRSALTMAVGRLDTDVVKLLLDRGARVNGYADNFGQTPLLEAIASSPTFAPASYEEAVEFMQKQAPVLARAVKIVQMLLTHGAQVNVANHNGQTALTVAIVERNALLVRILLDAHADPNAIDRLQGNASALILAAKARRVDIAEMLLKKGANVQFKDEFGKSAIDYAREYGPKKMTEILR
jgi:ankyrin repeat protein